MLKAKKRSGRWYSRVKHFADMRQKAYERDGDVCPISGMAMKISNGGVAKMVFRACDHLFPERYVRRFLPGADPHILENLLTVHPSVHAKKTAAEKYLYAGNWHRFSAEVVRIGYDLARFDRALAALKADQGIPKPARRSGWHQQKA